MDKFHKAAKEGLIEVLKGITKKDCNTRDENGMTPTLYAACYGHLEALRLLCGKGGDPDKSDYFGNSALHLAASQGHKSVVTFLVSFGANIYAMDIDEHTPQEIAGIKNQDDILRFLDGVAAKLETTEKKKYKSLKEKAKKDFDKRIKEYHKRQAKEVAQVLKCQKRSFNSEPKSSVINTLKLRIKSGSMSNLSATGQQATRTAFSSIVHGDTLTNTKGKTGTVKRKIIASRQKSNAANEVNSAEDGKRSQRSITGSSYDSQVLYGETFDNARRGRLGNIFDDSTYSNADKSNSFTRNTIPDKLTLRRSLSQPDFINDLNNRDTIEHCESGNIFDRPGVGSLTFRKNISNTLQTFSTNETADERSVGSACSLAVWQRQFVSHNFDDELSDPGSSEDEQIDNPLAMFLAAWGLSEYRARFEEQKVDLETLMILTDCDLKTLNLPLGPYRKLVTAIAERKYALENPGPITDSQF